MFDSDLRLEIDVCSLKQVVWNFEVLANGLADVTPAEITALKTNVDKQSGNIITNLEEEGIHKNVFNKIDHPDIPKINFKIFLENKSYTIKESSVLDSTY